MGFIDEIKQKARSNKKKIVLAEAGLDKRTVAAASMILSEGTAELLLVGSGDKIREMAGGLDISGAQILDPAAYERTSALAEAFYELRKKKGVTIEDAQKIIQNPLYFGCMLVKEGYADGMVAGAISSTSDVIRSALQTLKTKPGITLASSFFIMVVPDCAYGANGTFLFSDCGLVQNPGPEELAAIAVSSAQSFKALTGVEPVVAMLSHSTKGSAKHPDIDKVTEATRIAKELAPELKLDGELQADAAIIPSIGASKAPGSDVAGKANCLIFPDLDAGNIGYKLVQRLAKAEAYGPITQGVAKPVNDLSRGCSPADIAGVAAVTAVQAQ